MATIHIQLDPEVQVRLSALADSQDRSPAEVAAELIAAHLALLDGDTQKTLQAMAEFDAGFEGISHERVDAWLASWGTENELPPPQ